MCAHVCASVSTQGPPGERGERGEPGDEGYQVDKTIKSTSDICLLDCCSYSF